MSDDDASVDDEQDVFQRSDDDALASAALSLDIRNQRKQIRAQLTDPYTPLKSCNLRRAEIRGGFRYNRLHSIAMDSVFVQSISQQFPDFAVIRVSLHIRRSSPFAEFSAANLRCGAWYVDPQGGKTVDEPVYFKSTDGHTGQWSFSLRRPNLGLLKVIQEHGGYVSLYGLFFRRPMP